MEAARLCRNVGNPHWPASGQLKQGFCPGHCSHFALEASLGRGRPGLCGLMPLAPAVFRRDGLNSPDTSTPLEDRIVPGDGWGLVGCKGQAPGAQGRAQVCTDVF